MDKLQQTGRNQGRVFDFRFGHLQAEHLWCYQVKLPNLKLKTRPKQLLGFLPLVIVLPGVPDGNTVRVSSLFYFKTLDAPFTNTLAFLYAKSKKFYSIGLCLDKLTKVDG
jgi:hypothetical protein